MNIEQLIRDRVVAFAAEISNIVRQSTRDTLVAALGGEPEKEKTPAKTLQTTSKTHHPAPKTPKSRKKGQKRPPSEIARAVETLFEEIRRHPGCRIEQIGQALKLPTSELALPARNLIAAKRVRVTGERRATKYFPAGKK